MFRFASSLCWKVETKISLSASTASRIFLGTDSGQSRGTFNEPAKISILTELEVEVKVEELEAELEVELELKVELKVLHEVDLERVSVGDDFEAAEDDFEAALLFLAVFFNEVALLKASVAYDS